MRNWFTPWSNCCHRARTQCCFASSWGTQWVKRNSKLPQNDLKKTQFCQIYWHVCSILSKRSWSCSYISNILRWGAHRWNPEWLNTAQIQSGRLSKRAWLQISIQFVTFPLSKAAPQNYLPSNLTCQWRRTLCCEGIGFCVQTSLPQRV